MKKKSLFYNYMKKSEKRLRFERVASKRVQRIIDTLDLLSNCSNKNNYEYEKADVEKMFYEIAKALKEARSVYVNELHKATKQGFTFK